MASIERKSWDNPDERRTPDKTVAELLRLSGATVGRITAQPGWSWSECIKPVVGGDSCQARHIGYAQAGVLHVRHNDGNELDLAAGDVYLIEPGHDAWVVGDEPFVGLEFESAETYLSGQGES